MNHSRLHLLAAVLLLGSAHPVSAATFCAATATDIQNALFTAASNGQDDELRVRTGTVSPPNVLVYSPSESFVLEVSGGWDAGCATQTSDPGLTVLDGGNERSLFAMTTSSDASLTLRNFTIRNGRRAEGGAGALVRTQGDLTIAGMRFEDNVHDGSSFYGGGLYVSTARDILIDDSRFDRNQSVSGGGVSILSCGNALIEDTVFAGNAHTLESPNGPHQGSAIRISSSDQGPLCLTSRLRRNRFENSVMAPFSIDAREEVEFTDNVVVSTTVHEFSPATSRYACGTLAARANLFVVPLVPGRVIVNGNTFTGTSQSGMACLYVYAEDTNTPVGSALTLSTNTFSSFAGGIVRYSFARDLTVVDNAFSDSSGGPALNLKGVTMTVRRNRFFDLSADRYEHLGLGDEYLGAPAALLVNSFLQNLELSDNLFVRNRAVRTSMSPADGGAVRVEVRCFSACTVSQTATVRITNNTFVDNLAELNGGAVAIWSQFDASPTLTLHNNIFRGNNALGIGEDVYVDNDYDNDFITTPVTLVANDLALSAGGYATKVPTAPPAPGSNYDGIDPLFSDPDNGDYRLPAASPMVDAGDDAAPGQGTADLDGGPRLLGAHVDVGALESDGTAPLPDLMFRDSFE